MRITVDSRSYQAYIASDAWAAKRRQALKTQGAFCRGCGRSQTALHVHHRTYERLGDEQPDDLVILCGWCHQGVHQLTQTGLTLEQATDKVIESEPVAVTPKPAVEHVPAMLRNRTPSKAEAQVPARPVRRQRRLPATLTETSRQTWRPATRAQVKTLMAWTKSTRETIAVEGGADGKTLQDAWYNTCHMVWLAIRSIPKQHRLGWWQATLRNTNQPTSLHPTPNERAYHEWSRQRLTSPKRAA